MRAPSQPPRALSPPCACRAQGLYLEDPRDVSTLVDGLKKARTILSQPALEPYRSSEEFPGVDKASDEALSDFVRKSVHSANALVGSCKMGKATDPMAVVDSELRVRGVSGVRVCDASIMPTLPGGQTAASTIAIAEKAADMLQRTPASAPAPTAAYATV
jgi:choline dehydrogenase-like flavoprotein